MKTHKKAELHTRPVDDKVLLWLFGAIFLSFLLVISYCNIRSLDIWWHLKTGEVIWNQRRIPSVDINPDFAPAYVNLGSIYRHLGRNREAERVLRKALSLEDNPLARAQLDQLRRRR